MTFIETRTIKRVSGFWTIDKQSVLQWFKIIHINMKIKKKRQQQKTNCGYVLMLRTRTYRRLIQILMTITWALSALLINH